MDWSWIACSVLCFSVFFPASFAALPQEHRPAPALSLDEVWPSASGARLDTRQLEGNVVVIEFWATWCGPCIPGIRHLNEVEKELAGEAVVFISVTDEEESRLRTFQESNPIDSWVAFDFDRSSFKAFGVPSIPHTVILDRQGSIVAETTPSEVTADRLRRLLRGEVAHFAPKETRPSNLTWDRQEIDWKDGLEPLAQFIIKPIATATGGSFHRPGSSRYSADGASLRALIQDAFRTDHRHVQYQLPESDQQYRISVAVPEAGEDAEGRLFEYFQASLMSLFHFEAEWQPQERDVLVLQRGSTAPLPDSSATPEFSFGRGSIRGRAQPMERLTFVLTNFLGKIVVDETGLSSNYDWDLTYMEGKPEILKEGLREGLGLELKPARREVSILVVRKRE